MNDRLSVIWNDPKRTPILVGLIAFKAGIGLGYILGKKAWIRSEARHVSEDINVELNFDDSRLAENLHKVEDGLAEIKSKPEVTKIEIIEPEIKEEELVTRSIFDEYENWNYDLESKKRTKEAPYVLHRDEFFDEENDYSQSTLTYYAGDNILVDEDDTPIYNHDAVVGELLFGHGSGDPNVVYIRNDRRKAEYEVIYDKGLYSVEVLGLEIEDNERVKDLKHSRLPHRFRQE
jgi:hypothetical protein